MNLSEIPHAELDWSYARSGGPGGQNVNKVASKALLRWRPAESAVFANRQHVRDRFLSLFKNRMTNDGDLLLVSQRYRDQERNRVDCLERLVEMLEEAAKLPKARHATKPTRSSNRRRLEDKRRAAGVKASRRSPGGEE